MKSEPEVIYPGDMFMLRSAVSHFWHVMKWETHDNGMVFYKRSLCKRDVRGARYPGGEYPDHMYKEEIDPSLIDCKACRERYENQLVRELKRSLKGV